MEQTKYERGEEQMAIKTIKEWHSQNPHAHPSLLASVVSRLAEKVILSQNPPLPSPPSPPLPPLPHHPDPSFSSSSSLPLPPPMKVKKKAAGKKFKPPARKPDYRPPSRSIRPSSSSSFLSHPPAPYHPPPPLLPPFPSPRDFENINNGLNQYEQSEYNNQTSQTDLPPPPKFDMSTNTRRPPKR